MFYMQCKENSLRCISHLRLTVEAVVSNMGANLKSRVARVPEFPGTDQKPLAFFVSRSMAGEFRANHLSTVSF
jgi:hypothetical protein